MPLDAEGARQVYDRIGRFQDSQRLYEDVATRRLAELAKLADGLSLFELGCGTGRYAAELLRTTLPASASYLGVDVSPNMVALARERLAGFSSRARVVLLEPPPLLLPADDGGFDRFVSSYVFDLLSPEDSRALIGEAARVLEPGGLLGLISLTHGSTRASRIVSSVWGAAATRWPRPLGGCRPIDLRELVVGPDWSVLHCEVLVRFAVPSQVLVARRLAHQQRPDTDRRPTILSDI
jgi:ubiquinone/menaquinone biosynthesis C-methylase UbiE